MVPKKPINRAYHPYRHALSFEAARLVTDFKPLLGQRFIAEIEAKYGPLEHLEDASCWCGGCAIEGLA